LELVSQTIYPPLTLFATGAFGEVRMCVHRESNAQRAVKVLRKSNMDEDEKRMLFNEINILKEIVRSTQSASFYRSLLVMLKIR
jgi:serine/threonine protein kinase